MHVRLGVPIGITSCFRGWSGITPHKNIDPRCHGRERSLDYLFLQTRSIVRETRLQNISYKVVMSKTLRF